MTENRPSCWFLFEESGLHAAGLQDEVFKHYSKGCCELESISSNSPGKVTQGELLTRLIFHPIHIDPQTGEVHPMAFNDATNLDLSLFREEIATDAEIQLAIDEVRSTGQTKIPPQDRLVTLILQASSDAVRALYFDDDQTRMCFVYDTATPTKPAHASVFTPTRARKGGSQRSVRKKLRELFLNKPVRPEDYRPLNFAGSSL